jgi:sulfite reductase alpha subunit-like flavoprotein
MQKENKLNAKNACAAAKLPTQNSIFDNPGSLQNVRYGVFALGNSSYPQFCAYGKWLDASLSQLGAECVCALGLGDELCGQEDAFRQWSVGAFTSALDAFCLDGDLAFIDSISEEVAWSPQNVRLMVSQSKQRLAQCESLSKLHNRNVLSCKLRGKKNLQDKDSG